jgi:hypothetical protein
MAVKRTKNGSHSEKFVGKTRYNFHLTDIFGVENSLKRVVSATANRGSKNNKYNKSKITPKPRW